MIKNKKEIFVVVCVICCLIFSIVTIFGSWYSSNTSGTLSTGSADIYLDRTEIDSMGQKITQPHDGEEVSYIFNTMYLTIVVLITTILALFGILGYLYSKGKAEILKKIGIICGLTTFILAIITIFYFKLETENLYDTVISTYNSWGGGQIEGLDIGFWYSMKTGGMEVTAGPGISWYLMFSIGIISLSYSLLLVIKSMPEEISLPKKKDNKKYAIIGIIIIVVTIIISTSLVLNSVTSGGDTDECGIELISMTQDPENPTENENVSLTIEISRTSTSWACRPSIECEKYFGYAGGGYDLSETEDNIFTTNFYGGQNGTEIWCVIHFLNEILVDHTIQIGHVERSDITSLSITNVSRSPENPTSQTDSVVVSADITSNVNISDIETMYHIFTPDGTTAGGSGMGWSDGDTYRLQISLSRGGFFPDSSQNEENYPSGSIVLYRIVVKDELENTAVESGSFTIS